MNNQTVIFDRKSLLQSIIFITIIVIISGSMAVYVLSDKNINEAFVFNRFARLIYEFYPEALNQNEIIESAREAMFADLDRYSRYVKKSVFKQMDEEMSGGYYGIGLSVVGHDSGLMVMSVRENSPAAEAGLLSGDIITEADSIKLAGLSSEQSSSYLRGPENSKVTIKVYRNNFNNNFELQATRRRIELMHIPYAGITSDNMIYIRLLDFDAGASKDVERAVDSLLELSRDKKPEGIILDLRNNPGGLFSEAYKVANLFLEEGVILVGTDGRSRWNSYKYKSTNDDITDGLPLSIIIDRGSASSSEIVAGTLQYHQRAVLVGDTSFGKGLVQGFVRYPEGDGIKLTISRYYFGDDKYLNEFDSTLNEIGNGLPPDYLFKDDANNQFVRQLENSFHLFRFASEYQDDILDACEKGAFDDSWLDRFAVYLGKTDFEYESGRSRTISIIQDVAKFEKSSDTLKSAIDKFLKYSKEIDIKELFYHKEYIKRRIRQIAYEREYGISQAYAKVIVNELPIIRFAADVIKKAG